MLLVILMVKELLKHVYEKEFQKTIKKEETICQMERL